MQTLIHRNEPNRPHISSDIKFSKSAETKLTGSAKLPSATRQLYLNPFPHSDPFKHRLPSRPASQQHLSAAGERASTHSHAQSQDIFYRKMNFFRIVVLCWTTLALYRDPRHAPRLLFGTNTHSTSLSVGQTFAARISTSGQSLPDFNHMKARDLRRDVYLVSQPEQFLRKSAHRGFQMV